MNSATRGKVLHVFKALHRTRQRVFQDDIQALSAARNKINEEFAKNKNITSEKSIEELVLYGHQVEEILRTNVIQTVKKEEGHYQAVIREDTAKMDASPYTPMPDHMIGPFKRKKTKCSNSE
ncbi:complex III assembly factor LYRM7-like [Oratosquilla oratoria]|uniref:complex III assembly factor LYRM7-like n=1 Tax=Oratosquilla oratoria TaxID=337810 RepID=UPI003F76CA07